MTVTLRPATESDREFLYDLHRACFREQVETLLGWDEEQQAARFRDRVDLAQRQIVQLEGQDIGSFGVVDEPAWLFVEYLAIHPDHQGQGIGTRLTRLFLAEAKAKMVCVRMGVLRGHEPALEWYRRLGFGIVGGDDERHFLEHPGGTARPDDEPGPGP